MFFNLVLLIFKKKIKFTQKLTWNNKIHYDINNSSNIDKTNSKTEVRMWHNEKDLRY